MIYVCLLLFLILIIFLFNLNKNRKNIENFYNNHSFDLKMGNYLLHFNNMSDKFGTALTYQDNGEDKTVAGTFFEFKEDYSNFIDIKNIDTNTPLIITFSFVSNNNENSVILYSSNNLFSLVIHDKKLKLDIHENYETDNSEILDNDLEKDALYTIKLVITYNDIGSTTKNINVEELTKNSEDITISTSTIPLLVNKCEMDNDCNIGKCILDSSSGSNICKYDEDILVFGKVNEELYNLFDTTKNVNNNNYKYFEGFIGNIELNNYKLDQNTNVLKSGKTVNAQTALEDSTCLFNPKEYRFYDECISDCESAACSGCDAKCSFIQRKTQFDPSDIDNNPQTTGPTDIVSNIDDCVGKCFSHYYDIDNKLFKGHEDKLIKFCKNTCNKCVDFPCEQLNTDKIGIYKDKVPKSTNLSINYISPNGKKVIVKWRSLSGLGENNKADGYLLYIYKTFKKNEFVNIKKIENISCTNYCEYLLEDLNPNETYTIFVKGYNKYGVGAKSNNMTFKSSVKKINKDFNIPELDINDYNFDNFEVCKDPQVTTKSS